MGKNQLNNEYENVMLEVDQAIGRKEVVRLLHRASYIRQQLSDTIKPVLKHQ